MTEPAASTRPVFLTAVGWVVVSLLLLGAAAVAVVLSQLWFALAFAVISLAAAFIGSSRTEDVVQRSAAERRRPVLVVLCRIGRFLIVPVGAAVLLAAPTWRQNPAAEAAAPLVKVIQAAGGHEICSGGDDGRPGPSDNRQPVYYATYTAPKDTGQLHQRVLAAAAKQQYEVSSSAGGDYLDGTTARVAIQSGQNSIRGACGNLNQTTTADHGQQLVTLRVVYPNSYWLNHRP